MESLVPYPFCEIPLEHPTLLRKDETTAGNNWLSEKIQAQSTTELLGCLQHPEHTKHRRGAVMHSTELADPWVPPAPPVPPWLSW